MGEYHIAITVLEDTSVLTALIVQPVRVATPLIRLNQAVLFFHPTTVLHNPVNVILVMLHLATNAYRMTSIVVISMVITQGITF